MNAKSGVDGNSEGGLIDSIRIAPLLELQGVRLFQDVHDSGDTARWHWLPIDGIWCHELTVEPKFDSTVPEQWYRRRVIVHRVDGVHP